jgi:DNA-binding MarR family transcriptional regulator
MKMQLSRGVAFGTISKDVMCSSSLSVTAKCLYALLATYVNHGSRSWTVSRGRLASDLGLSVATIKRALRELEQEGLIARQRHWREDGSEGVATTTLLDFIAVYK